MQQQAAFLSGRLEHLRLHGLPADPVIEHAVRLLPDVKRLRAELGFVAGADRSGRVRDALMATETLLARLREIEAAGNRSSAVEAPGRDAR